MRLVNINSCQPGMRIGKAIYNDKGKVLLTQGSKLTERFITKLKKYHIATIYIEDHASEGINIVDSIPDIVRLEAMETITEGFKTISEFSSNRTNLQNMLKSGRAMRSFQKVFRDIYSCINTNEDALNLLATTKMHENYVYNHCLNVSIYACQLAIENGLPLKNIEEIGLGAMLHDIGQVYVPLEILNKPDELTKDEYAKVQTHCEQGFDMLRKIHEIPVSVAHCALQHHERVDGLGYPRGLKDVEIHKYAKIISVVDVFDALTNPRPYRPAMLPHKGMEILYAGSGTQFDSKQIHLFKNSIALYPPGLTVKLNDGRTAIVTKYNYQAVGRPEIRIIRDEEQIDVTPYEIDLASIGNQTIEIVEADALL